jgi:hypothetical protein
MSVCCRHKFGCATLQRCLEAGGDEQILLLANAISLHARALATDSHGNYIVQYVISMKLEDARFSEPKVRSANNPYFLDTHIIYVESVTIPNPDDTMAAYSARS